MRQNEQEDGVWRVLAGSLPVGVWNRFLFSLPSPPSEPHSSGVQTVSNEHSMLVPCLVKPGRCVNVRGGLPGLAVLLYLPWDPGMLVPGPPLQEQEHVG